MGRFVTPQGVVIEMDAESADAVGFRPAADSGPQLEADKPKRGPGRPRKTD